MGIFDKIKEFTNYISGSGAKLHVVIDNSMLHSEGMIRVRVLCQVKDHDILVDKLYLKLRAQESVRYRDSNYAGTGANRRHRNGTNKTAYATTFKDEIIIDQIFA